jgi:TonB family protein
LTQFGTVSYNSLQRARGVMPEKKNTIGRFEIIEKIGEGPIGSVYKALDPVIRRIVAIKVIKLYALEETTTFAEVFEKIYRVVRTSTSLNHPNICIIYDLSEEKKIPYITMEYVEGHDLESLLRQKHQFKRPELLNVLQQTCDALDFAHKKNIVHQDLKSTNILMTPDFHVKITDFGIAGLDEIAAAQTKKLLSIPYYISPEQALGERVTPASDLFSLGVVIYHLLSGQLPFPGTSAANTIMMIARDNPAVPADLNRSAISRDDWNSFFGIALAKSPNQRFRSAREMLEALHSILPASDQTYYPFGFESELNDSTGKFEKTYIAEVDTASPTLMIDASQILEENSQSVEPPPPLPPPPLFEESETFFETDQSQSVPAEEQETEPVEMEQEFETDHSETFVQPPQNSLDVALQGIEKVEPVSAEPAESSIRIESPVEMQSFEESEIESHSDAQTSIEMESSLESEPPAEIESPKTEMLQVPFAATVEPPQFDPQETFRSAPPVNNEASLPADFVPASGNFLEMEGQEEMATMVQDNNRESAMAASDTAPIDAEENQEPELEFIEPPISAPTQMLKTPSLDQSGGNGRGRVQIDSSPATVINTAFQRPPEPPPPPPSSSAGATVMMPTPARPDPLSAPTKMIHNTQLSAATEIRQIPEQPPRTVPGTPVQPPSVPVHPLSKPSVETKAAVPPASKPPAMQRYFYGAIAIFIFIALVGGGILFFRKPASEAPGKTTAQQTKQTTGAQSTSPQPVLEPTAEPITTGNIMVTSEPPGAVVTVGGEEKGVTPVEVPQLPFGKHIVKLQLKGYEDVQQEVELTAENPNPSLPSFSMSKANLNGTLIIDSEPSGAFIVIGNRVLGITPKTLYRRPGNYSIVLKKDGYIDYSGTAMVTKDKRVTFKGTLAEIPKPVPIVEAPKPKPPEVIRGQLVTLGPDVIPPKPVNKVYAKYPEAARVKKLEGTVRLNVLVDETGRVLDIKVMKSAHPMLDEAVVKAYQQWTFKPATKKGVPVKVWVTVSMSFQSGR